MSAAILIGRSAGAQRGLSLGVAAGSAGYPACVSGEWLGTDVPLQAHHERPKGMGLHICAIVQRGSDSPSEHVEIVNDGAEPVPVTGLELTARSGQHHEHVYSFPQGELGPGKTAYVYSKDGSGQRTHTGDVILYAGLKAPVWKDESCVAYLRQPDGRINDARRAPAAPPRRPLAIRLSGLAEHVGDRLADRVRCAQLRMAA